MAMQTVASDELLTEARDWVADCVWQEDAEDLAELSDEAILLGVDRHYAGGIEAFRGMVIA